MEILVTPFQADDLETVFEIQQASFKPLYEKYHDDGSNPYLESKETVFRKYTRAGTTGYLFRLDGTAVGQSESIWILRPAADGFPPCVSCRSFRAGALRRTPCSKLNACILKFRDGFLILFWKKQEIVICMKRSVTGKPEKQKLSTIT